ncbi:MAG: hypothetical protein HOP23_12495 [Methylococcaceae bacterium]|nr:hypothetical protein [Methylococcaceae bacterium]
MSIRTFIFCDICNPQALRTIEFRRSSRINERSGRRISDGRSWFEGELSDAISNGWSCTDEDQHLCPACQQLARPG